MRFKSAASAPSSSRFGTSTRVEKSPAAISRMRASIWRTGRTIDDEIVYPSSRASTILTSENAITSALRRDVGAMARLDAGDHVGLGLVHQLVGQALEPVGQRGGLGELQLLPLGGAAAADQLHDLGDDLDELFVVLAHTREQLFLVLRHELQSIEVVAELVELAQCRLQPAVVGFEQRRGDAVELADGVVVELAVGGDLALQLHHVLGALVHLGQRLQARPTRRPASRPRSSGRPPAAW